MNAKTGLFTFLLGLAGLGLITTVVVAGGQATPQKTSAVRPSKTATPATQAPAKQARLDAMAEAERRGMPETYDAQARWIGTIPAKPTT